MEHKMKNTQHHYGYLSIALHWLTAIIVFGLFGLGYWMVDLGYYDQWYQTGPDLHKSIGLVLFVLVIVRLISRWIQIKPLALANHGLLERRASYVIHALLYILLFLIMVSGYFISTADGRGIDVFDIVHIPSLGQLFEHQETRAGTVHKYAAYVVIVAALLHGAAAIKHHVIDKDNTLKRMLGYRP